MISLVLVVFALLLTWGQDSHAADPNWRTERWGRSSEARPIGTGKPGFTLLRAEATGISFTNTLAGDAFLTNAVAHNGSGLALGDVDGDGWIDIYFCNLQGANRLYRNLGNWRFSEVPIGPAACAEQFSTGAVFADVDGDGDVDLLVNGIGAGTRLFLNDGRGHFTEAADSGLSRTASPTSMALADIDGDGDLDLYCTHYIDEMHLADPTVRFALKRRGNDYVISSVNDQPTTSPRLTNRFQIFGNGRVRELPEVDGFYRNDGKGHFTAIQFEPGIFLDARGQPIPPYRDWGLAVMFRDLNGDGAPDLYVCNDNASPDRMWLNTGSGTFRAYDPLAFRHTSRSSMGIDIADVNRDGYDDILVVDMLARDHSKRLTQLVKDFSDPQMRERVEEQPRYNRNALFLGRADGTYAEAALWAGVAASDWSWCPMFLDVDLDGYEDVVITTGFSFDVMDQDSHDQIRKGRLSAAQLKRSRQFHPGWPTPAVAFHNKGNGQFEPAGAQWGFTEASISNGAALADLDNDGDLDLVVNNLNRGASLYRNDGPGERIAVRLRGKSPNTQGIGARISLINGSLTQSQEMIAGGRYLSGDDPSRVFAARGLQPDARLQVRWRNGSQTVISNLVANRTYEVSEDSASPQRSTTSTSDHTQYFSDVSSLLNHAHIESTYDDWARQPLLPHRLSRLGPGASWFDLNGDGWEDLIIGAARGQRLAVFYNERGKTFRPALASDSAPDDQSAVVAWNEGQVTRLAVGLENYERATNGPGEIRLYALPQLTLLQSLAVPTGICGPIAAADIDGDGDLDLFAGGRVLPGRFPEAVDSGLWRNEKGVFRRAEEESFSRCGLVSGATFTDLDNDGAPDLALATEFGTLSLFVNEKGRYLNVTQRMGLAGWTGLWTSIATGDFDGDGRMDLVAGNWGRNTAYELYSPGEIRIYYGDWNGDGIVDLVEGVQKEKEFVPIRDRTRLSAVLPDLTSRFPTHAVFGRANLRDVLGERLQTARFVAAAHLESAVFLNRGDHFEPRPLPEEAQLSTVFAVTVADFDGDGIEDVFLSQNMYGALTELTRDDNGRGLWLRGRGDGTFQPTEANRSGIKLPGEQRAAAVADFDHDGRVDLLVTQNNGPTHLYHNIGGKPGLRVRLQGTAQNPDGIGAQLRLVYANGDRGPARLVVAGSGYWSQNSPTQVLGFREMPKALWVRWPDGREQTVSLGNEKEILVKIPVP